MINDLKAMAVFAEVVKQGSFKQAAKALKLSPSVVSYHISQLEEKTGCALLYRSTRKLTLSSQGQAFYQQVLKMLDAANEGISLLCLHQQVPEGQIKISLPTSLSRSELTHKLAEFSLANPKINLDIEYSDCRRDIIDDRLDLAVRVGELADSDFMSTKLGMLERVLVCTPSFYKNNATPKQPSDLSSWQWLKLAQLTNKRKFFSNGQSSVVEFHHQVSVNSVEAIYQFCKANAGLAVLENSQVADDLASGRLIRVLPDWNVESLSLYAIWHKNTGSSSLTKLLLRYLKEH